MPDSSIRQPQADLTWLSWLRIVAIGFVVTIHVVGHNAIEEDARETFRGQLAILLDVGGAFAVPVCVMISGALLLDPARYPGDGPFLRKRVLRLVPAIVFWHLWYWLILETHHDRDVSLHDFLAMAANGRLYTALYFFWIVLGLAVVAPVLVPFLACSDRRKVLVTGSVAMAMTALTTATVEFRGKSNDFIETAWTWWVPYLGYFILGWGLRGVVLRGLPLLLCSLSTLGLAVFNSWQWRKPDGWDWVATLTPANYYSIGVAIQAMTLFVVFQSLVRPGGLLDCLTRPRLTSAARTLGDATLGVFALHLTILIVVLEMPWVGGELASPRALVMLARLAAVFLLTYGVVLILRRIPLVRRLV